MKKLPPWWWPAAVLCCAAGAPLLAQGACADFSWDVHHERMLFAGKAQSLPAGADPSSAPSVDADHFYDLRLSPQQGVRFVTKPGKLIPTAGDYAGVVKFSVARPGNYRVSLDAPFWIDIVAQGKLLPTEDFQGQRGCNAPHKIVEYVLPGNQPLWLQFSGASASQVHFTITPAPAAKAPAP